MVFEDAGFETGLKNVAMVTGASAVLSPALLGVFKAFGKSIDAGKKLLSKTSVEDLQKINKEVGEKLNSKYKDKTLNDIEIPKKDNPFPDNEVGRIEHNEKLDVAVKQFNNGEAVDVPPVKNEIIKDNLPPPAKLEFNDMTSSNPAIKNAYDGSNRLKKFTENKSPITVKMLEDISKDDVKLILRANELGLYKTRPEALIALDNLKRFTTKDGKVNYKAAEEFIGTKLKGNESLDDLLQLERSSRVTDAPEKVSQVDAKNGFNKNETKLAEDIEGVKNFDVPNEAALKIKPQTLKDPCLMYLLLAPLRVKLQLVQQLKRRLQNYQMLPKLYLKVPKKTDATPVSVLANANTVLHHYSVVQIQVR